MSAPTLPQLIAAAQRALASGDHAAALAALDSAIAVAPNDSAVAFNRANVLLQLARFAEAISGYDAVLRIRPDHMQSQLHRAYALTNIGRFGEALQGFSIAESRGLAPFSLHYDKGRSLAGLGRAEEALASFDAALRLAPDHPGALFNRARALQALDRLDEALAAYDNLTRISPGDAGVWENRGLTLHDLNRLDDALESFSRSDALRPNHASTYSNRGLTLFAARRADDAVAAFSRAIELGIGLSSRTRASFIYNRAMALLAQHDAAGWAGFASRWQAGLVSSPPHDRDEPEWRGQVTSLRIWPEQGIGDEILLSRFAPLARAFAPQVALECAPRLVPLFARSFPSIEVRSIDAPAPSAEAQIAAGDAPFRLGLDQVSGAPYLRADAERRMTLRARYEHLAQGRPIIGIAWVSKSPRRGPHKSAALADWGALLTRDALFVNLQYGDVAAEIAAAEHMFNCTIHTDASVDQVADLDAFAAQVAAVDHIVSVSNTTVHMAGALGVPCIVMVPPARGRLWYWGLEGEATPWYDSVRIVRREIGADWASQVAAAASLLA